MTTRFDEDALKELAGETAFSRGQAYVADGRVEILDRGPQSVRARVTGSEIYRTLVTGPGAVIGGECSCPAFGDYGFCKHMVATALAANGTDSPADGEVGDRIRKFLLTKDAPALADLLLEHAMQDDALLRRLELLAAAAGGNDKTVLARLRKIITDTTHIDGFVDYGEAASWASGVEEALNQVAALVSNGRARIARQLARHALDRIGAAIGHMDDSNGHAGGQLHHAEKIHLAACLASPPDAMDLAKDLFAREMDDEWGTFDHAMERYADLLGDAGQAEYRRLAEAAWKDVTAQHGRADAAADLYSTRRLIRILDGFAERDGDVDKRIALRSYRLQSAWDHLQLAQFCLEQNRADEALRYAEAGLKLDGDGRPLERLVEFVVERHVAMGNTASALTVLWRAFDLSPSLALFQRLKVIGGEEARDRAIAMLRVRLPQAPARTTWSNPADLLIQVLTAETMFEEAWDMVRTHKGSASVVMALADASGPRHPKEALAVYAATIDGLVSMGGNGNYDEAHRLIAKMSGLRARPEQVSYVAGLMVRFKAKRNFIKLFKE